MKKSLLFAFIFLAAISFVSAQDFSEILEQIDQSAIILYAIFIISFSLLFFSLNKVFRGSKSTAGIVSAMISFLIVYGINKIGFDVEGLLFSIGLSENILWTILPILILGGVIFIIITLKKNSLFIFGGLLIVLSLFVYTKTLLVIIGVILIGIRLFIGKNIFKRKGKRSSWETR